MADLRRLAELLHGSLGELPNRGAWQPPADIYRVREGWLVKLDLAGIRVDDIHLTVQGKQLTVYGERRDTTIREAHQTYSMEIAYNRFSRVIELPCELGNAAIRTQYQDGMLLVYLATEPTQ